MSRLFTRVAASLLLVLLWGAGASADYKADIGFTMLKIELGINTPTGDGVVVSQVEAGSYSEGVYRYLPFLNGSSNLDFIGKTIYESNIPAEVFWHAPQVGVYFYGNNNSIAPGISSIYGYDVGNWLGSVFLNTGRGPFYPPLQSSARVANHSWVGAYYNAAANVDALKRLDWVINRDEYIQVVAMYNGSGSATHPLLGSSFNAIAVGLSNGNSKNGSVALDSLYTAGRTRPDLVAPMGATSYATPVVSAAAALLVEVGHKDPGLSTDPLVQSTTNRIGNTIYNAERSEVVKATLMAGASRTAISTYTATPRTDNGLNAVYGAGQLNIYNSYHIIAAGEQNSLQDAPGSLGTIGRYGFDYDPYFGGLAPASGQPASNRTASYYFKALDAGQMTASLVWNLDVNDLTLYHLGLYLYDITTVPNGVLLGESVGLLDNTENLWFSLNATHDYLLQVKAITDDAFLWDYALAWDITTAVGPVSISDPNTVPIPVFVPVPGTVYLLGTGFLVLVAFRRKFTS